MAQRDDLSMAWQLGQPARQLAQRNVTGAIGASDLRFSTLAHVDQNEVRLAATLELQLSRANLSPFPRPPSPVPDSAKRFVIDQLRHAGMLTAHRAVGIFLQREVAKLHAPPVEHHEAADQRLAKPDDQLDRFQCLQRPDNSRQDAKHAAIGARGHEIGWRWFRVKTPVAGSLFRVKHRDLSVEPENRTVHVRSEERRVGKEWRSRWIRKQ